eukprot:Rmarinus@m.12179
MLHGCCDPSFLDREDVCYYGMRIFGRICSILFRFSKATRDLTSFVPPNQDIECVVLCLSRCVERLSLVYEESGSSPKAFATSTIFFESLKMIFSIFESNISLLSVGLGVLSNAPRTFDSIDDHSRRISLFQQAFSGGLCERVSAFKQLPVLLRNVGATHVQSFLEILEAEVRTEDPDSSVLRYPETISSSVQDLCELLVESESEAWSVVSKYFVFCNKDNPVAVRASFLQVASAFVRYAPVSEVKKHAKFLSSFLDLVEEPLPSIQEVVAESLCVFMSDEDRLAKVLFPEASSPFDVWLLEQLRVKLLADNENEVSEPDIRSGILTVFGIYGAICSDQSLVLVLDVLLEHFTYSETSLRSDAYDQISAIARHRFPDATQPIPALFESVENKLFPMIATQLADSPDIINETFKLLGYKDRQGFLQKILPLVIPPICESCNDEHLKRLADLIPLEPSKVINENLESILRHWLINVQDKAVKNDMIGFVLRYCPNHEIQHVFQLCKTDLVRLLMWDLADEGVPERKVQRALRLLADEITGTGRPLSDLLNDCFLAIIEDLNMSRFRSRHIDTRRHGLRVLSKLIQLTEDKLTPYIPKVVSTLSFVMEHRELSTEVCDVWKIFVRKIGASQMGPLLPQTFVTILPFFGEGADGAEEATDGSADSVSASASVTAPVASATMLENFADVLAEALRVCESDIALYAHLLPSIPSHPSLSAVRKMLSPIQKKPNSFSEEVRHILSLRNHENDNVRQMALRRLLSVIRRGRTDINVALLDDMREPFIDDLMAGLLQSCNDPSDEVKHLSLKCFAAVGAIDPGRLQIDVPRTKHTWMSTDELARHIVEHYLLKAVKGGPTLRAQAKACFAIQEILRFLWCTLIPPRLASRIDSNADIDNCTQYIRMTQAPEEMVDESTERGLDNWKAFSSETKRLVMPYLQSSYYVEPLNKLPKEDGVFFEGMDANRWVCEWTADLITRIVASDPAASTVSSAASRSQRVEPTMGTLFVIVRGVVLKDVALSTFVMPYLIRHLVCFGNESDNYAVRTELLAVLRHATQQLDGEGDSTEEWGTRAVFHVLDMIRDWLDEARNRSDDSDAMDEYTEEEVEAVKGFLDSFPADLLAKASYRCKFFARALQHYESHIRSQHTVKSILRRDEISDAELVFLQKIYVGLEQPDNIAGAAGMKRHRSLDDKILSDEANSLWSDALLSRRRAWERNPDSPDHLQGMLRCMMALGHLPGALSTVISASRSVKPTLHRLLRCYGTQISWRLQDWGQLESCVELGVGTDSILGVPASHCTPYPALFASHYAFHLAFGSTLLAFKRGRVEQFSEFIGKAYAALAGPMAAASQMSYSRAYSLMGMLHILSDVESAFQVLSKSKSKEAKESLRRQFRERMTITQVSLPVREQFFAVHRLLYAVLDMKADAEETWVEYARLARENGHLATAVTVISNIDRDTCPTARLEHSKVLWAEGKHDDALHELEGQWKAATHSHGLRQGDNQEAWRISLLLARWYEERGQHHPDEVLKQYAAACELAPDCEETHFYLGRYYDTLLEAGTRSNHPSDGKVKTKKRRPDEDFLPHVIQHYSRALLHGHEYIFHMMPRMLTLWFNCGTAYTTSNPPSSAQKKAMSTLRKLMIRVADELPLYQWLTVLPQLVSRICHKNGAVSDFLKSILAKLLVAYPSRVMWVVCPLLQFTVDTRKRRAREIIQQAISASANDGLSLEDVFHVSGQLISHLTQICTWSVEFKRLGKETGSIKSLSMSQNFPKLAAIPPVDVVCPTTRALTPIMPPSGITEKNHYGYAPDAPTILGFEDYVLPMRSMLRPCRIGIIGSDGKTYHFLCKDEEKGDIRKDCRLMDFNAVLNRLFLKNPETRKRHLRIRTYTVIPLTQNCGLIEWVHNLTPYRTEIMKLYQHTSPKYPNQKEIKAVYHRVAELGSDRLKFFQEWMLPRCPPVLHKWFLINFPEPSEWMRARQAFCNSCAAWSMMGHIVGLGDRHGENILFHRASGELVHVDFGILFDKGLTLQVPEVVPFRLTHNMVDGLGVMGVKGSFRKVCEATLRLLRTQREMLQHMLDTFVHDPMVDWTRTRRINNGDEEIAEEAVATTARISNRLNGLVGESSIPFSVEGQVDWLIQQATSVENLSRMYVWWMPWL